MSFRKPILSSVYLWFYFVKNNKDYRKYCDAKHTGKLAVIKEMEKKHPKIKQLFEDWGDLYRIEVIDWRPEFIVWWDSHKALFIGNNSEKGTIEYVRHSNRMVISLPVRKNKDDVINEVSRLINSMYKQHKFNNSIRYTIKTRSGILDKNQITANQKRLSAYALSKKKNKETGKPLSLSEIVLEIARTDAKGWDKTFSDPALKNASLKKFGAAQLAREKSIVSMILKEANTIIDNILECEFPVNLQ